MSETLQSSPEPEATTPPPPSIEPTEPLRGYKVCNDDRSRKVGVAANSLEMLRRKASIKLKIPCAGVYLAYNGIEVADEKTFETFAPQTLFIIATRGSMVSTDLEILYTYMRQNVTLKVGSLIENFINENREHFAQMLRPIERRNRAATVDSGSGSLDAAAADQRLRSSSRKDHEEWFKGLPPTLDTKEKVMRRRAQERIRSYYYKIKDDIHGSSIYRHSVPARNHLIRVLDVFAHLLQRYDYMGQLFNRDWPQRHPFVLQSADKSDDEDDIDARKLPETPKKRRRIAVGQVCAENEEVLDSEKLLVSLCDEKGRFRCQGVWNEEKCSYSDEHEINPYASRESAVLFQVWNLDHAVEISRTILPHLLQAVESICEAGSATTKGDGTSHDDEIDAAKAAKASGKPVLLRCQEHGRIGTEVSMLRYFRELFTVANLNLVHIVCHDKTAHAGSLSGGGVLCDECSEYTVVRQLSAAVETK